MMRILPPPSGDDGKNSRQIHGIKNSKSTGSFACAWKNRNALVDYQAPSPRKPRDESLRGDETPRPNEPRDRSLRGDETPSSTSGATLPRA
jgi:hypothetical protein